MANCKQKGAHRGALIESMIGNERVIVWRCRHCAGVNLLYSPACRSCHGAYERSAALWRVWPIERWLEAALAPLFAGGKVEL